jgi:uncharacterized surface protein with fasciclin (FAS1) repeats
LHQALSYHIIPGAALTSSELKMKSGQKLQTLLPNSTVNFALLDVNFADGNIYVDDGRVVTPDIKAGRSIIHIINQVMSPPLA